MLIAGKNVSLPRSRSLRVSHLTQLVRPVPRVPGRFRPRVVIGQTVYRAQELKPTSR